ncbi:MAG: ribosome small subunit-dependent GTPase A [Candidatus Cloacimonadaceae bacterium]|jgi:ribosome biogenesis GTPase|nr:ribosome small subunit-dependent GTPase A [Candidatus Cloacimonadota bacterium]MDD5624864.1 ribosome small subunit-dependent GTPase A [Candidatus Cloacimonadota bacterium]MDY0111393.1 ribosome small subunit-dependent GTPase A [Candidatus Syntrophosphaera sp.]
MKPKDKKIIKPHRPARLKNTRLRDLAVLDDFPDNIKFKAKRTPEKVAENYKKSMQLISGRILEMKSNYQYIIEADNIIYTATLSGRLKQFAFHSKSIVAVGDYVELDIAAEPPRIENILPRKNTLTRYLGTNFQRPNIIASNLDQVIVTSSWRKPMIKPALIDRYLCLAALDNIDAIIVINKVDLCKNRKELEETTSYYKTVGYTLLYTSALTGEGIDELRELLKNRDSVFSGQSGTGKSSIINRLEPSLNLPTAEVSDYNEKGKHTTTGTILIPWSFGGHLLDTPGIKTVNLSKDAKSQIPRIFPGFAPLAPLCYFNDCTHTHEENCAVLSALENGKIPATRYLSYVNLINSL